MAAKTFSLPFLLFLSIFSHFSVSDSRRTLNNSSVSVSDALRLHEKQLNFPQIIGAGNVSNGPSVKEFGHYAGYYSLPRSKSAKMFYFFFESRYNSTDPVVIWLSGRPGCSSSVALFYENGPFKISDDLSLSWNDFGWDKADVSNDLYDFLQAFFKEHSKFANNDFYITGESYVGHYIPALAFRVHSGNKNKEGIPINLKGFAIGNGLTNPEIQYGAYGDYALQMKLISESDHKSLDEKYVECQSSIKKCNIDGGLACETAYKLCNRIFDQIRSKLGDISYYDVRKKSEDDFSKMETFLNKESVRKALGVGEIEFVFCNDTVYFAMLEDWMRNLEVNIPALVEDGIKLLVYAGEYDLICNWLENSRWVNQMKWTGQKAFISSKEVPFLVDGKEAGLKKNHGLLTFIKVYDAGHMVPMDQPKASLEMLQKWMMQGNV